MYDIVSASTLIACSLYKTKAVSYQELLTIANNISTQEKGIVCDISENSLENAAEAYPFLFTQTEDGFKRASDSIYESVYFKDYLLSKSASATVILSQIHSESNI